MPVGIRSCESPEISPTGNARVPPAPTARRVFTVLASEDSSTRLFHSEHVVQRPSHRGLVAPHAWHTYWVCGLATAQGQSAAFERQMEGPTLHFAVHRNAPQTDAPAVQSLWHFPSVVRST